MFISQNIIEPFGKSYLIQSQRIGIFQRLQAKVDLSILVLTVTSSGSLKQYLNPQELLLRCGYFLAPSCDCTQRGDNVILQYKLLAAILCAVCSIIQQSQYVFHVYYTLCDGKYDCKITSYQTIFQLQCFVLLNNHQYNCNITKSFLSVRTTKVINKQLHCIQRIFDMPNNS